MDVDVDDDLKSLKKDLLGSSSTTAQVCFSSSLELSTAWDGLEFELVGGFEMDMACSICFVREVVLRVQLLSFSMSLRCMK